MRENDKDEQDFKPDRMHGEEVDRSELRHVVVEKGLPGLGRRLLMADHVFRHGSLGDLDTQFQKFAANPGYAPDGVLAAHDFESTHEFPSRL